MAVAQARARGAGFPLLKTGDFAVLDVRFTIGVTKITLERVRCSGGPRRHARCRCRVESVGDLDQLVALAIRPCWARGTSTAMVRGRSPPRPAAADWAPDTANDVLSHRLDDAMHFVLALTRRVGRPFVWCPRTRSGTPIAQPAARRRRQRIPRSPAAAQRACRCQR